MSLNLPKPVNTYAGEDELRTANGNPNGNGSAAANGMEEEYRPPRMSDRYKDSMIYPPKEMRTVIDKTSNHVSKSPSPALLESKIKEQLKTDPKFAFLNEEDPYHNYYKYMVEKIREDAEDVAKGLIPAPTAGATTGGEVDQVKDLADTVTAYEPRELEFRVDLPGVTAQDLDILRLTALFHARRGRSFLSSLSVREGRNYQFDFLRPTHSLFGYYNRMVESYQKIINPAPGTIETLVKQTQDPEMKWKTLAEGRNRAEWERGKRKREDERKKEKDEESEAMGLIDWQDFVVVETIEFTQQDMELELPPPTNVEKLKSMSMAEKRMASMVMEETGAGPTAASGAGAGAAAVAEDVEEVDMEDDDEAEEARLQRIKAEQEQARARDVQRAAMQSRGVKIKSDYTPKGIQRGNTVATAKCPYCAQSIPENELSEHIRIELLDPKWKEQKRILEMRRNQSLQMAQGTDVSGSLRNLASQRTDLFGDESDEAERKRKEEEANKKRKERERIVWDGHTNSAQKTTDTFQAQFTLENDIDKMHARLGLSGGEQQSSVGPQAGPGIVPSKQHLPPALAASLPSAGGGTAYSGATISAAPTGPREYIQSSPYQPPPSGSSGPSIHPSRQAAMAPPPSAPIQNTNTRPREEEYSETPAPVAKRPKTIVEKLAFGQLYNEIDWMSLNPHPISINVQLPTSTEKPEWINKLNGSIISIEDVAVNTPFSAIRERIKRALDADLPISRMRIEYEGRVMNNASSLASVNIGEGDLVSMTLKKK